MDKLKEIARMLLAGTWALDPGFHEPLMQALADAIAGRVDLKTALRTSAASARLAYAQPGTIAVLPLRGVIFNRADIFSSLFGTAIDQFRPIFREARGNPNIRAIMIDCDSPGGEAAGVEELSTEIFQARGVKPIGAHVNSTAASGAYWIISGADQITVTPSGEVGSIGVYAMHQDTSAAQEKLGIRTTIISAGKHKTEANGFEPLSAEARAAIQARVHEVYEAFTAGVARNRGTSVRTVKGPTFGEGRMLGANSAVTAGMADSLGTRDGAIKRLMSAKGTNRKAASGSLEVQRMKLELLSL